MPERETIFCGGSSFAIDGTEALRPCHREGLPFDSVLFRKPSKAGPPLVIYNESTAEEG